MVLTRHSKRYIGLTVDDGRRIETTTKMLMIMDHPYNTGQRTCWTRDS